MGASSNADCTKDELTLDEKLQTAEQIKEMSDSGYEVRVDLSGGEIFMNKADHNVLIMALSNKLGKDRVGISCSGTGIDDAQAEFLKGFAPDVEMTMDTVPYRTYRYRKDGYAITAAKAANILKRHGVKVGMQTVVTQQLANYADAEAVYAYLCANRIDCWSILRFFPSGRGAAFPEEALSDAECEAYVKMVQEIVAKSKSEFKPAVDFHYSMPGHEKYSTTCRCVSHSIGILPNGDVVACFWALNAETGVVDPKFLLGNVREQTLREILNGERARYWSDCEHCCELRNDTAEGGLSYVLPAEPAYRDA